MAPKSFEILLLPKNAQNFVNWLYRTIVSFMSTSYCISEAAETLVWDFAKIFSYLQSFFSFHFWPFFSFSFPSFLRILCAFSSPVRYEPWQKPLYSSVAPSPAKTSFYSRSWSHNQSGLVLVVYSYNRYRQSGGCVFRAKGCPGRCAKCRDEWRGRNRASEGCWTTWCSVPF